jgi:RND family efflux transporter MFP subunit
MHDAAANYSLIKKQYDQNLTTAPAQAVYDKAKSDYDKTKLMVFSGAASQNDLKNAQSALNSAAAQLESAKASAQNALNTADTRRKNAANVLETAQQNYALTQETINPDNLAVAKAGVDSASAALQIAQKRISDSTVRAPIDGTVGAVNVKEGDLAVPQNPSFQILGESGMEMTVNVTETVVQKLSVGTKASVYLAASGEKVDGTVTEVTAMALAQSGMFPVKLSIQKKDSLKDGMQASVHFDPADNSGIVLVPARSVLNRDGKSIVFTVREGKAAQTEVTVAEKRGAYVSVKGLGTGDEVIVQGVNKAKDGIILHIVSNTNA